MNRLRFTPPASALMRALLRRAERDGGRNFLSEWITVEWHSLTFSGERHSAGFVFSGADALARADAWSDGLPDAEFDLGRSAFVAELALAAPPLRREDGSVLVQVQALTIAD